MREELLHSTCALTLAHGALAAGRHLAFSLYTNDMRRVLALMCTAKGRFEEILQESPVRHHTRERIVTRWTHSKQRSVHFWCVTELMNGALSFSCMIGRSVLKSDSDIRSVGFLQLMSAIPARYMYRREKPFTNF